MLKSSETITTTTVIKWGSILLTLLSSVGAIGYAVGQNKSDVHGEISQLRSDIAQLASNYERRLASVETHQDAESASSRSLERNMATLSEKLDGLVSSSKRFEDKLDKIQGNR